MFGATGLGTDSKIGANSDAAVDPLMLKPMEIRLRELERENNLLRKILASRQIPVEDDPGSMAQVNADVPITCAVPVAPAEEIEEVEFTHAMSRVRAVLESLEKSHGNLNEEEHFRYFCGQLSRYESTRDNPIVSVVNHIGNYWCNWILMIARLGPYRPSTIRKLLAALDPEHPISQRMLTLNLRILERDGLVSRHVVDDVRRHVEYSLTILGRGLSDRLLSLIEWIDLSLIHI